MSRTTEGQLPCEAEPDAFFSDGQYNTAWAKAACANCPIRLSCLQMALENGEQHGIWGGLTWQERRELTEPERRLLRIDPLEDIHSVEDAA